MTTSRGSSLPHMIVRTRLVGLLLFFCSLIITNVSWGQVINISGTTATPVPASGHDYIQMLNETVNPANGSVSLRVQVPVPKGRGFTLPFAFSYDSNGAHIVLDSGVTGGYWSTNKGYLSQGGWSYSMPLVSARDGSDTLGCDIEGNGCYTCTYTTNFMFQDSSAGRHGLWLATLYPDSSGDPRCQYPTQASGGDPFFTAALSDWDHLGVWDLDGTYYRFQGPWNWFTNIDRASLPAFIEDRNGNKVNITDSGFGTFTVADTLGRTEIASSGFGATGNTVSISGFSQPYTVYWGIANSNSTLGENCGTAFPSHDSETQPVIAAITLPNGKQYQFTYDQVYGVIKQITYPTGAWVKYDWDINPQAEYSEFLLHDNQSSWVARCITDWFAVSHRYVSFDGVNTAQQQDFNYSTSWNPSDPTRWASKQTLVTTHDLIRGRTFTTTYAYTPGGGAGTNDPYHSAAVNVSPIPVEQTITYKDWSGQTLRTVSKNWFNVYLLQSEQVTLDTGLVSKKTYNYLGSNSLALVTETDEYDYGSGGPGLLKRKTITNYAPLPSTPLGTTILDRPCQTVIKDGSDNPVAETDYFYDGGTTVCGSPGTASVMAASGVPPATHDDVNYGTSSTAARGNLTKVTRKCFPNCADSSTTYSYFHTGMLKQQVDAANHSTSYDYSPTYAAAYLTTITNALNQSTQFTYDFNSGLLTNVKDPNDITNGRNGTSYTYSGPLLRLTAIDYPDGGHTSYDYNGDALPFTVTKTVTATPDPNIVTSTVYDGLGRVHKTVINSDSPGPTYTRTDYDGVGNVYKVWNSTRCDPDTSPNSCPSESTWGITQYTYDALGRPKFIVKPDGTLSADQTSCTNCVQTSYNGNSATVTDEVGKQRRTFTDGLGRIVRVDEPGNGVLQ